MLVSQQGGDWASDLIHCKAKEQDTNKKAHVQEKQNLCVLTAWTTFTQL